MSEMLQRIFGWERMRGCSQLRYRAPIQPANVCATKHLTSISSLSLKYSYILSERNSLGKPLVTILLPITSIPPAALQGSRRLQSPFEATRRCRSYPEHRSLAIACRRHRGSHE